MSAMKNAYTEMCERYSEEYIEYLLQEEPVLLNELRESESEQNSRAVASRADSETPEGRGSLRRTPLAGVEAA